MKVKELIEGLMDMDQEMLVIMAKDGEGNNFSPLADIDGGNNTYSARAGDIGLTKLTDYLCDKGFSEEDVFEGVKAVVLWPVN